MIPDETAIRAIVERARAGDQVAMAIITQVRDRSKTGQKAAIDTRNAIAKYIKTHPPDTATMGSDVISSSNTNLPALKALWTGQKAAPNDFAMVVAKASPLVQVWQAVVCIVHGPRLTKESPLMKTVNIKGSRIGGIVRRAFMIQRLQDVNTSITSYCPTTGWELGE